MSVCRLSPSNCWLLAAGLFAALSTGPVAAVSPEDLFESRIRPLLVEHCFECHAGDAAEGGLRLDSRAGFDAGGDSGAVIDPATPAASLLLQLVRHEVADREMPQGADRLSDRAIADLEHWVALGLPGLPAAPAAAADVAAETWAAKLADRRGHWAWQPVEPVEPPAANHPVWSQTAIDRFLLAAMQQAGLEPDGDRSVSAGRHAAGGP